ncbi:carbon-nitrogen hydrolase family protein [Novosphingobium aquiterrae]|uniref:Carbon-nitrogen hydrolase family protein n=1 Tax=Novosphingobium aquiterrae TaxID=624388 RepID=A0ABV6PLC5_9SPHN
MTFIVAAAQYPVERLADWAHYAAKLERWLAEAADRGARLAVFPEYGAMELASLDPATMGDLARSMAFVAGLMPRVDQLHRELAARHGMHILAASGPCRQGDGSFVNRARLFAPNGKMGVQDKLIMTRFERETWGVSAGAPLRLFDTALGRIGVLICYDSEFPLLARAQVEAGAQVLLMPSCTDSLHGYWRVRLAAQARAMEGQCYTVQAPLVGNADWSPAIDVNRGAAGIFGPPDGPFPDDGIVALGPVDAGQWLYAEIDPGRVGALQADGAVLNMRHWTEQPGAAALPGVSLVDLR